MAVGFERTTGTRRVRFTANVSHDGADYGPDYDADVCDLNARDAANYVREGRAQYIGDDTPPEKETFEDAPAKPGKKGK